MREPSLLCVINKNSREHLETVHCLVWRKEKQPFQCSKTEPSHWHTFFASLLWHLKFSAGTFHSFWSSLRFVCYLIGAHLGSAPLIGHDLERHTPVYKKSHSWQYKSEQNPKSYSVAKRQGCVKVQILGRLQKNCCTEGSPQAQWPPSYLWKKLKLSIQLNWAMEVRRGGLGRRCN